MNTEDNDLLMTRDEFRKFVRSRPKRTFFRFRAFVPLMRGTMKIERLQSVLLSRPAFLSTGLEMLSVDGETQGERLRVHEYVSGNYRCIYLGE